MDEVQEVSKLDAARRQLREAILLFFEHRDAVAIHALAAAAHQVLHDLGRANGAASNIKANPYILPEKQAEVIRLVNEAQNFFKHADRDPGATFGFRPAATPFFILDAVEMWGTLTGSFFREALVFRIWFFLAHPHLVADENVKALLGQFRDQFGPSINDFAAIREILMGTVMGTV